MWTPSHWYQILRHPPEPHRAYIHFLLFHMLACLPRDRERNFTQVRVIQPVLHRMSLFLVHACENIYTAKTPKRQKPMFSFSRSNLPDDLVRVTSLHTWHSISYIESRKGPAQLQRMLLLRVCDASICKNWKDTDRRWLCLQLAAWGGTCVRMDTPIQLEAAPGPWKPEYVTPKDVMRGYDTRWRFTFYSRIDIMLRHTPAVWEILSNTTCALTAAWIIVRVW
jgi:hypothetical protein